MPSKWTESGLTRIPWHFQILGGFLLLQGAVLVVSLTIVSRSQTRQVELGLQRQLEITRDVFHSALERRNRQLAVTLGWLGKDFAVRQAIATENAATIASVALNLKNRSQAGLIWIGDAKGRATTLRFR